ncbi:MAG: 4,5-DOPA dioxygenase extradiol [Bacteriovorax sp.]|nr:4,5-DOPA dioxygenase extradiol [Bacteriovorax sp.]
MSSKNKMPVLFIGHGSPMNAIANNNYTRELSDLKNSIETPKAILMISAHWLTKGTFLTAMSSPKTIHDFQGFPKELFDIQYKAPGSPELAEILINNISSPQIEKDMDEWGLDHGTWSVLRHMYPEANIPVIQLSMDMTRPAEYHFEMGQKIKFLRQQGVLIMASGNIVHNLRQLNWDENALPFDWSVEFDLWVKEKALQGDFNSLVKEFTETKSGQLSVPTPDHYYPLLYILGAVDEKDQLSFLFEGIQNASISMRSFKWS